VLGLAALVLALYLAPFLLWGQDAYVLIHDNLDSNFVYYRILASSGLVLAPGDTAIPNMLGGIPRGLFPSEFDVQLWLYLGFEPFTAYALNQALMRAVALVGMYLLLRDHVLPREQPGRETICAAAALSFALLPFWPSGGLSIAGQPLLLHAFLQIRRSGGRAIDWAVVLLVPFYCYLVFASVFVLAALGLFALADAVRERRIHRRLWLAISLHTGVHVLVNYRLFLSMVVGSDFVSHRTEFALDSKTLPAALSTVRRLLLDGQYHAAPGQAPVMIVCALLAGVLGWKRRELRRPFAACALAIAGISVFSGLYSWEAVAPLRRLLSLGVGFAADRVYTLLPILWGVVFALSLAVLWSALPRGRAVVGALASLQALAMFLQSDLVEEMQGARISFRAFYAEDQFAQIRREIGRPLESYRVVSIGLHPAVALYNGFYTADGYYPNYPLAYKKALRALMREELAKDPALAHYYDGWGSRAYVFSAELGRHYLFDVHSSGAIRDLRLDPASMRALGVDYVLSAVPIEAPERSGLVFRRRFTHPDSAWRIDLYERVPGPGTETAYTAAPWSPISRRSGASPRNRSGTSPTSSTDSTPSPSSSASPARRR